MVRVLYSAKEKLGYYVQSAGRLPCVLIWVYAYSA